jgi:hypothetical protein
MWLRLAITFCLAVAACAPRALVHTDGAYRPEGAPYRIAQLEDGSLMPSNGWRIANYDDRGGVLRVKRRADVRDLVIGRVADDGTITILTEDLDRGEQKMPLRDLVNQSLTRVTGSSGLQFVEVRKPYDEEIPGAEAIDLVVDSKQSGSATTTARYYFLWARPKGGDKLTTLIFASLPETFAPAYEDVLGLVRRLSFQ